MIRVGVVISIVSDVHGGGYVLVLDGKTFEEIARVRLPYGLPYGFHGCWISEGSRNYLLEHQRHADQTQQ